LKPTKCTFAEHELEFLGHVISDKGISVNPKKVESVERFPQPKTAKDAKSFIALCSYYRKFIPNFSFVAHDLNQLTRNDVPFQWNEKADLSFRDLKRLLTTAPVLCYPQDEGEMYIHTDACEYGLGAALYQLQNNEKRLLAYASRCIDSAEKNYDTTQKEGLGVVWAIENYRPYVYGRHFTIVTDHEPLTGFFKLKNPNGQLARWSLRL